MLLPAATQGGSLLGFTTQATLQRRTNIKSSRYTAGGGRPHAAYTMLRRRAAAQHSAAERAKKVKLFRCVGQPVDWGCMSMEMHLLVNLHMTHRNTCLA
jgi:hypothetical protein